MKKIIFGAIASILIAGCDNMGKTYVSYTARDGYRNYLFSGPPTDLHDFKIVETNGYLHMTIVLKKVSVHE